VEGPSDPRIENQNSKKSTEEESEPKEKEESNKETVEKKEPYVPPPPYKPPIPYPQRLIKTKDAGQFKKKI
jgi:hypothetical protein